MTEHLELVVDDVAAWRAWLDEHEHASDGVWLVMAKKGVARPTSLGYQEALLEALCSGWIDGQRKRRDETTFLQRFTPRRSASIWSKRNVALVEGLVAEGRMRARGHAEIERARADGRWDRAYDGPATATVPDDLAAALEREPLAATTFAGASSQARFMAISRLVTARDETVRAKRLRTIMARLAAGDAP